MSGKNDELQRLKMAQDANAMAIQRMQRQLQSQGARPLPKGQPQTGDPEDDLDIPDPTQQYQQPQQRQPAPQYQQVDPNQAIVNHIIQQSGQHAANIVANQTVTQSQIQARMGELMEKFPALRQDDHPLTIRARDEYASVTKKNPALDQATAYELAAANAASFLGIKPHNQTIEEYMQYDYTMGANPNLSAAPQRRQKMRVTKPILQFADMMGINVDTRTPEGKKNLQELNEYTERFKADRDESEFRYK